MSRAAKKNAIFPAAATRKASSAGLTYASSGVDLEAKDAFTESLGSMVRKTFGPRVIDNPGGFAGLFRLDYNEKLFARNHKHPVLVACADGVGTKLKLAIAMRKYDTLGIDLVAMNVNDLIVQGAEPLFFLDYIAVPKVDRTMLNALMIGMVEGCKQAGCALLGGETAEMAGLYAEGDFDLAGFAVGVVDLDRAINPLRVEPGDVVLGLASDGIHSNGYSLVRRVVEAGGLDLAAEYAELLPPPLRGAKRAAAARKGSTKLAADEKRGKSKNKFSSTAATVPAAAGSTGHSLGEILLTPTRIYVNPIVRLLRAYRKKKVVTGMAHITGSGLEGNLCRALHSKVDAQIDTSAWPLPPVFAFLQQRGNISTAEMRRVFNMGIGYCVVVRPSFAESVKSQLEQLGETVHTIGEITKGTGKVVER